MHFLVVGNKCQEPLELQRECLITSHTVGLQ
jgi:hypothetical protein